MLGERQLFVYWRLASADVSSAVRAVRSLQCQCRAEHRGLMAALLMREDPSAAQATLMETYALDANVSPGGIGLELQLLINTACDEATRPWRDGERHVEVFCSSDE